MINFRVWHAWWLNKNHSTGNSANKTMIWWKTLKEGFYSGTFIRRLLVTNLSNLIRNLGTIDLRGEDLIIRLWCFHGNLRCVLKHTLMEFHWLKVIVNQMIANCNERFNHFYFNFISCNNLWCMWLPRYALLP